MEFVRSAMGRLLFKYDKEKRLIEIQKKNEVSRFVITAQGDLKEATQPDYAQEAAAADS